MFLITSDNVKIAARWYPAENPKGYLLLIHMMPATKESWEDFAFAMISEGYASLAIDLRGHGESKFGPKGYSNFTDSDHQKSILDLDAAIDFLKSQGAKPETITCIGASIGANLSLQYITDHSDFKIGILLSPGLNYRGIDGEMLVQKLTRGQRVLFISADDDTRVMGNAEMVKKLYDLIAVAVEKKLVIYPRGGHGTDILSTPESPEPFRVISDFLAGL